MASDKTDDQALGPVSQRVAANLRELRYVSVRDLSDVLKANGHIIWPSAISRLEGGERRISVDDLVALAAALNVSPNRLLLDGEADGEDINLTGDVVVTRMQAWMWAAGTAPLPDDDPDLTGDDVVQFQATNRPHDYEITPAEMIGLASTCAPIVQAIEDAVGEGVSVDEVLEYLRLWGVSERMRTAPKPSKRPSRGRKGGR